MFQTPASLTLLVITLILTAALGVATVTRRKVLSASYWQYLWMFFLLFTMAQVVGFKVAIWIFAPISFWALREYFSLVDLRIEDRWAVMGSYATIPCVTYLIQIHWYGLFIIAVPVYAFLGIPLLMALCSRRAEGTVLSIGIIDFGLFLMVYCLAHVGYLASYSSWMAAWLLLSVLVCDVASHFVSKFGFADPKRLLLNFLTPLPLTFLLSYLLADWASIRMLHALILAALIPALIAIGNYSLEYVLKDLRISKERLEPGRGELLYSVRSLFYAGPVVFHYLRYFLDLP